MALTDRNFNVTAAGRTPKKFVLSKQNISHKRTVQINVTHLFHLYLIAYLFCSPFVLRRSVQTLPGSDYRHRTIFGNRVTYNNLIKASVFETFT